MQRNISRRIFTKSLLCSGLAASTLSLSTTRAHASIGIMTAWIELCKTIVDATGKPFRAKAQGQPAADPVMVALRENRRLLAATNRRLDAMNDMATALMINYSILPEKIDQIVASRISGLVPQIVRSELGQFREEQNAANLMAAISTFIEETELGRPSSDLESRLSDIREYRNRVRSGPDFSILTLCASMDSELAAMRVLGYSKSQAEVVGRVYLEEFQSALNDDNPGSLVSTARELDNQLGERLAELWGADNLRGDYQMVLNGEQTLCKINPRIEWNDNTFRVAERLPNQYKTTESSEIQMLDFSTTPNIFYERLIGSADVPIEVWAKECAVRAHTECGSSGGELPYSGCSGRGSDRVEQTAEIYQAILDGYDEKTEHFNAYQALRAGLWESLATTYETGRRLVNEVAQWDA